MNRYGKPEGRVEEIGAIPGATELPDGEWAGGGGFNRSRSGKRDSILWQVHLMGNSDVCAQRAATEATELLGTDIELDLLRRRLLKYFLARGVERSAAEDLTQDSLATMVEFVQREPHRYS